ncbi:MAG: branched chain amino acid aminotransferase, partial [Candidatus Hydrothermarchaeota archaeon]|nr:branched chain amino acid aminotransferase [Candidatus Hydrothermarchaeota archaeon]
EVVKTDLTRGSLYTADEVFFTGTAAELTPIREVDGIQIGKPGKVTKRLQKKFFDVTKGKDKNYNSWLDLL